MNKNDLTRKLNIHEFFKRFPDEASCLEHVMTVRYGYRHTCGKCGVVNATFHRLENHKADRPSTHVGLLLFGAGGIGADEAAGDLGVTSSIVFRGLRVDA
jgi:hypothetical protein